MRDETASEIRRFVVLIAHGDDAHKHWLFEAGEAFIKDEPMPEPKGKGVEKPKQ